MEIFPHQHKFSMCIYTLKIYVDVEQGSQFRYLGNLMSEDWYCTRDIRSRIETAKNVFLEKKRN